MYYKDIKVGKKTLRVSACVLTLILYKQISGGSCWFEDYQSKLEGEIKLLQFQQKYESIDLNAMSKEQRAEFEKERYTIIKETDFLLNTIIAMVMAGEYPKAKSIESILADIVTTLANENNELLITALNLTQEYFKPRKIKNPNLKPSQTQSDFTTQLHKRILEIGIPKDEWTQPLNIILDLIDLDTEQQMTLMGDIPKTAKSLKAFKDLEKRLNG